MPYLEHIGLAVNDATQIRKFFASLLGLHVYKSERIEREGVETHFISAGGAKLELLEVISPDSPVARYLNKRGEGIHHLAFEVTDIGEHMRRMRQKGFTPLSEEPRRGADGKQIFFLHPKETHGVLIEFCESQPLVPTTVTCSGEQLAVWQCGEKRHPAVVIMGMETEELLRHLDHQFYVMAFNVPHLDKERGGALLRAVLDQFAVQKTHLLGYDSHGQLALQFALHNPQRLLRLAIHGARNIHPTSELASIEHAILVSNPDRDPLLPLESALALYKMLPNSTLAVLPGAIHEGADMALYARILVRHFTAR